ncbi:16S rRNA (cytidine(1402)-2'-O)-methyltransferase [Tropicimonas sp. S265A]|uniref:16S rRNA (cytidine(1402)-2'-O)-methyltransferase n=1 Tax=Tropicimonas sp. S265A TaxID=3415134 RepID=UPI003C79DEF2
MAESPAGQLVFVTTPIGNARDITLRALDVLRAADVLVAEDTRTLRRLLEIHGVPLSGRPLYAYHDHSGDRDRARVRGALEQGLMVAYASEAGTPLIADPGYGLIAAAREVSATITATPGVSAAITALSLSGLPTDQFHFYGFLPSSKGARCKALEGLRPVPGTLVFYESPNRIGKALQDMANTLGPNRAAALCRELTKKFEEVVTGTLADLVTRSATATWKGEIVVLVGAEGAVEPDALDVDEALETALRDQSVKDAVAVVTEATGLPRRQIYQRALEILKDR